MQLSVKMDKGTGLLSIKYTFFRITVTRRFKMLLTHTVEMHEANQKISQLLKNKFNISTK